VLIIHHNLFTAKRFINHLLDWLTIIVSYRHVVEKHVVDHHPMLH
jgi:hypothetical protein